jgi:hypothetical protein
MTDPSINDHPTRTTTEAVGGRTAVPIASVTATQLGEHLGLTRQRIGVLADVAHVIERLPNGTFNRDQSRLKYLAHLRSPERRSARAAANIPKPRPNFCASGSRGSSASWYGGRMSMR